MFKKLKDKIAKQAFKYAKKQINWTVDQFFIEQFKERFDGDIKIIVTNAGSFNVSAVATTTNMALVGNEVIISCSLSRKGE